MGFARVLREEIRALPRPRFGLLGVAVLLSLVAFLAVTAGTSESAKGFLFPAFGFVPCALLPIAAMQIAGARSSRFLQSVFTSPVTASQYVLAKFCLVLIVGAAYLVCVLPFVFVQAAHLGFRPEMEKYLLLGAGMVFYATCLGTLLGVLSTSRGSLVHLSIAVAVMVGNLLAMLLLGEIISLPNDATKALLVRLFHLSGGVLLLDSLGLTGPLAVGSPLLSFLGFLVLCVGSIAGAWWFFSREQSPEGWEIRGSRVGLAVLVVGLVVLAPVALANGEYQPIKGAGGSMSLVGNGVDIRIVPRGASPPTSPDPFSGGAIDAERPNDVDVLLFLYADAQEPYTRVSVEFTGNNLTISPMSVVIESPGTLSEASSRGPMQTPVPYLRIPVRLTTPPPDELSKNRHYLSVNLSYQAASGEPITASSVNLIYSGVSRVPLEMALAGAPLPLVAGMGFAFRLRRMK